MQNDSVDRLLVTTKCCFSELDRGTDGPTDKTRNAATRTAAALIRVWLLLQIITIIDAEYGIEMQNDMRVHSLIHFVRMK